MKARKRNRNLSALRSALDYRIFSFPLLIPFGYAIVVMFILAPVIVTYRIHSQDQYDVAKYQRFSQTLLLNEQQSIEAIGLPAPLSVSHDGLPCSYQGPGFGVINVGDQCSLEVHVIEPNSGVLTDTSALDTLIIEHGWTGDPVSNGLVKSKGGLKVNGANLEYSKPYPPGGTFNLSINEYANGYELTVIVDITPNTIRNWHG